MKDIQLTIAKDYVSDWGIWEAFRELAQNALDHSDRSSTKVSIGFSKRTKALTLISENIVLHKQSLILGCTSKTEDSNQRGQFGEGYKLALVVLLRLGIKVTINNGDEVWVPSFKWSQEFQAELLTISVAKIKTTNKHLVFRLAGITKEQAKQLTDKVLINREQQKGYRTDYGKILTEERFKGQVFVGGLYVCKPNLKDLEQGFDFDPQHVSLGRDRGLMDSFDVQWLASKMWGTIFAPDTKVIDETARLVLAGNATTRYYGSVHSAHNSDITNRVSEIFYEEYTDTAVPVTSEAERTLVLSNYDNAVPVIVS